MKGIDHEEIYYNTTGLWDYMLDCAKANAKSCADKVYAIFQYESNENHQRKGVSPSQIHNSLVVMGNKYPITSIRRAITNLTDAGYLVKTESTRLGSYGAPEYLWKLKV